MIRVQEVFSLCWGSFHNFKNFSFLVNGYLKRFPPFFSYLLEWVNLYVSLEMVSFPWKFLLFLVNKVCWDLAHLYIKKLQIMVMLVML